MELATLQALIASNPVLSTVILVGLASCTWALGAVLARLPRGLIPDRPH